MILGRARLVKDPIEKLMALRCFTNHIIPDRWEQVRPPTDQELKGTTVLALRLDEVSAKVRSGGPNDDDEDKVLPVWAGVVPLRMQTGEPAPAPDLLPGTAPVDAAAWQRGPRFTPAAAAD